MQSRPNAIPQYVRTTGGAFPRAEAMKYKTPHERYEHAIKQPPQNVVLTDPMRMLNQRNQSDQSLPSYRTPFDQRQPLSKLGGIAGFYGTSTQNGRPIRAQAGCGAYGFAANMPPRNPLENRNF